MKLVLDASVAVKWALPEIDSDKAVRIRDDYLAGLHELLTPDVFPIEVAHCLTRAERQGRIAVSEAANTCTTSCYSFRISIPRSYYSRGLATFPRKPASACTTACTLPSPNGKAAIS